MGGWDPPFVNITGGNMKDMNNSVIKKVGEEGDSARMKNHYYSQF